MDEKLVELEYESLVEEYEQMLREYTNLEGIVSFDEDAAWERAAANALGRMVAAAEEQWEVTHDR